MRGNLQVFALRQHCLGGAGISVRNAEVDKLRQKRQSQRRQSRFPVHLGAGEIGIVRISVCVSALFLAAPSAALQAADICGAVALRDVPAIENPSSILARGEHDTAITQYRVNKKTGLTSFCSHGGYCYPTHVFINGKKVEALRLTNCKIGKRDPYNDPDETFYTIDVDRSKNSTATLRYNDIDNRLLEMGLCSACAANAAELYIYKPNSRCAQLVKKTLEGNPTATEKLKEANTDYCPYR